MWRQLLAPFTVLLLTLGWSEANLGDANDPQTQILVSRAKANNENTVYYLVTDRNYVDVVINNILNLRRMGVQSYAVGCADEDAAAVLAARGFACALLGPEYFEFLGRLRVEDLSERAAWRAEFIKVVRLKFLGLSMIVSAGYNALFLDADAVLVRPPAAVMVAAAAGAADLVASTGSFPPKLTAAWGAAVCTGFFFVRAAAPASLDLLDRALRETVHVFDDQIGMNVALLEVGVRWERGNISFPNGAPLCRGVASLPAGDLRVAMLNPGHYVRHCDKYPREDATLLHCRSHKDAASKHDAMRAQGIWLLREGWEGDEYCEAAGGDWERFLDLVSDADTAAGAAASGDAAAGRRPKEAPA